MAPDAVVRLVKGAVKVRAGISQTETFAQAKMIFRQRVLRITVRLTRMDRHQAHEVELGGHLEQHAAAVLLLSGRCGCGPGGVSRGQVELGGVQGFVLLPFGDMPSEGQFAERFLEQRGKLFLCCVAIDGGSVFGLDLVHGAPLHEQPLDRINRRELVVMTGERVKFGFDAEQLSNEILDVRCKRDQQLGFGFCGERSRILPRGDQLVSQPGIDFAQEFHERRIEANEGFAVVEILEGKAKAKGGMGGGHAGFLNQKHEIIVDRRPRLKEHSLMSP